jgi:endonuclease YncB( thermonuclease family)
LALAALSATAAIAADRPACNPPLIGHAQINTAIDGRTVQTNDGKEVRLAGLASPPDRGRTALQALVSGRTVTLHRLGEQTDRYGRTVAMVTLDGALPEQSVQTALLEQGSARVSAKIGDSACAAALWAAEQKARNAGLGLWADPHYVIRRAEDPAGILAVRGEFAVVEGKVLSVRESGGTIYVNFGRRFAEDFTVTVPRRLDRKFTAAGLTLKELTGQHVRVRGTIEERGGPWIEAAHPEQIEIAERGHE